MEYNQMSLKFKITRLIPNEWKSYRDIRLEALQTDPLAFGGTYEEEITKTEEMWRNEIKNMWFALVDKHVVGMIGLLQNTMSTGKHRAYLVSCWVKPTFRSHGIGKELVKYVQEYAATHGIKKIYLYVTSTQDKAIKLYETLGFYQIGLHKEYAKVGDEYFDSYIMEWSLAQ